MEIKQLVGHSKHNVVARRNARDRLRSAVDEPALVTYGRLTSAAGMDLGTLPRIHRAIQNTEVGF